MRPNELSQAIAQAGLSLKEATIYEYLLETGGAYPSRIAEATKLNRSTVYKILTDLSIKGVVTEIERGKKLYYQPERPVKLLRYSERQISLATERYEKLQSLYPALEGLFSALPNKAKVRYFEGSDGVMSMYDDHISIGKYEMVGFADTARIQEFLSKGYFKKYRAAKQRLRIRTRGVLPTGPEYVRYAKDTYGDTNDSTRPTLKFIPQDKFPFKGEITIYGADKVSVINLEGAQPTGFIVEDPSFHKMMRSIFELAWTGIT